MKKPLIRLFYVSRGRLDLTERDYVDILDAARRHNSESGVGGVLCYGLGCFGQVLEGHEAPVLSTYLRIQRDNRHADCTLISVLPISTCWFDRWSMASITNDQSTVADFERLRRGRFREDRQRDPIEAMRRMVESVRDQLTEMRRISVP